jgi:hypothetical protein
VAPRIAKWKWENTDFDPTWVPRTLDVAGQTGQLAVGASSTEAQVLRDTPRHLTS